MPKLNGYISVLTLLLFIGCQLANAQGSVTYTAHFTPKTTLLNFTKNYPFNDYEHRVGGNAQLAINYHYDRRMAFTTGIKYSADRFLTIDYNLFPTCLFPPAVTNGFDSWFANNITLHYLGVPLEARYYAKSEGLRIYVKAGYEFLFNVWETRSFNIIACGIAEVPERGVFNVARRVTTKYLLGIGLEIHTVPGTFVTIEPEVALTARLPYKHRTPYAFQPDDFRTFDIGLRVGISL